MKISEAMKLIHPQPWLGKHRSEEHRQYLSQLFKGRPISEEQKAKLSVALIGNKNGLGIPCSPEKRRKIGDAQRGPKAHNWQGGKTTVNQLLRKGSEIREWRAAIFSRDGYRCIGCGAESGPLNAHHIYPWATFPRLRFVVENGITVCTRCHDLIPRTLGRPDSIVAPAGVIFTN